MDFKGAYSPDNLRFLFEGFLITVQVAILAIIFSFIIAVMLGIVRYMSVPIVSRIIAIGVDTIRNLPLLLIIFFTRFALPEAGINLSVFASAVVALTIFEAAMISEIIRSGLNSIDRGQIEAARSSGLTYAQTMRFIVVPLALRRMVPPTVSQFISLLKDTSLCVIISLPELMHHAQIINGHSPNYPIPIYLLLALLYFAVNFSLSIVSRRLEARTV